jgi:hypothetical protein
MASRATALLCLVLAGCGAAVEERVPPVDVEAQPAVLRRLTSAQYANVVLDLFGPEIVPPAQLEPDPSIDGLVAIGSALTTISARGVELYEDAAYAVANQVLAPSEDRDERVGCAPSSITDSACARTYLEQIGRLLWRRPMTAGELDALVAVSVAGGEVREDFHLGLSYGLGALLQAPSFLFREEVGEPGPKNSLRYTSHEMASRLSFLLWNAGPDERLLDLADKDKLVDPDVVLEQARRMLEDERAKRGVRAFFDEVLELHELDDLNKDPIHFPRMNALIGPAAREETLAVVERNVLYGHDYRDLFVTRDTFIDRHLAAIYDVPAPAPEGADWVQIPPDHRRRGLLGHVSLLALNAHPVSSSATLRGKFVRQKVLCHPIPSPPADVDTSIPEPSGEAPTLRDRVAEHTSDPVCATCHLMMDPIGLSLENFDGLGEWRDDDNGAAIDASGDIDGTPFDDAWGLGKVLSEHPDVPPCAVQNLWRYAHGRPEALGEADLLDHLTVGFADAGHRVYDLLLLVAVSEGFRTLAPPVTTLEEGR